MDNIKEINRKNTNSFSIEGIHYATGKPVRIEVSEGIIREINEISGLKNESNKSYIAPGLIDNQINGYSNVFRK
jgi:N-acetylglucosamine-6-phosphate deacetylase